MSSHKNTYVANPVDCHGYVYYKDEENQLWEDLLRRQTSIFYGRACKEYLQGLALLNLPYYHVPQLNLLNKILRKHNGWVLEPVSSLLPANEFFRLLANKKFPVATFIRRRSDFNYVEEPDIFHEIVGHCPLLMNSFYALFMEKYGHLSLCAPHHVQTQLERLFFFTIETGLIATSDGLRIYGGGILSSYSETLYALESSVPVRKPFNIQDIVQSDYGLHQMQKTYYIIDNFNVLSTLLSIDLIQLLEHYMVASVR